MKMINKALKFFIVALTSVLLLYSLAFAQEEGGELIDICTPCTSDSNLDGKELEKYICDLCIKYSDLPGCPTQSYIQTLCSQDDIPPPEPLPPPPQCTQNTDCGPDEVCLDGNCVSPPPPPPPSSSTCDKNLQSGVACDNSGFLCPCGCCNTLGGYPADPTSRGPFDQCCPMRPMANDPTKNCFQECRNHGNGNGSTFIHGYNPNPADGLGCTAPFSPIPTRVGNCCCVPNMTPLTCSGNTGVCFNAGRGGGQTFSDGYIPGLLDGAGCWAPTGVRVGPCCCTNLPFNL